MADTIEIEGERAAEIIAEIEEMWYSADCARLAERRDAAISSDVPSSTAAWYDADASARHTLIAMLAN